MPCNPYWILFFKELREFLEWPIDGQFFDFIKMTIDHKQIINSNQEFFLKSLQQ